MEDFKGVDMSQVSPRFLSFMLLCFALLSLSNKLLADSRQAQIQKRGSLNVCIWQDYFSITYYNQQTNRLEGIDIDLSQAFANDLGVKVNYVDSNFGHFIKDLNSDKCDIAMFGIGNTVSRRQQVDFSHSYLASSMYAVTTKHNPLIHSWQDIDHKGIIVSVQKGTYMENAMRQQLKHATLVAVKEPKQREIDVRSGRADVFITDYPYGQKVIKLFDWASLIEPQGQTDKFPYAYAIKRGQKAWLERINQFVADIKKDGRLEKFAAKNHLTPIVVY